MRGRPKKFRGRYNPRSEEYKKQEYKEFLFAVRKRDNSTCRFPSCGSRNRIAVHHIRRHADAPSLRVKVSNGICLCYKHHKLVTGQEDMYANMFIKIINQEKFIEIRRLLKDAGRTEEDIHTEEI